jgi:two-component system, response regulator PdtaR
VVTPIIYRLIVEDDVIIAMHLAMLVADFGHEVCSTATTSTEAIAQAIALTPDVVLMDIRLADGDSGVDVARDLHASRALRCIFVSANLDEPTRTALLPYEPIEFVGKPVVPVVLQRALRKAEEDLPGL